MLNDWFRTIELPMSMARFAELPRHPAYKYEYASGAAVLSPSPRYGRALLDLARVEAPGATGTWRASPLFTIRPLTADDWNLLPGLMSAAFQGIPPFSALDENMILAATADCIRSTRTGGDGPVVHAACFVAVGAQPWENPIGAVLITLIPTGDLTELHSTRWVQSPPADCIEQRLGRPHLTWIFVSPWHAGHDLGSELLRASAAALRGLGYTELASTFLIGNDRSLTWHWRNGFQLIRHPNSPRER